MIFTAAHPGVQMTPMTQHSIKKYLYFCVFLNKCVIQYVPKILFEVVCEFFIFTIQHMYKNDKMNN